ncbi:MAG: hypothetical protein HYY24_02245 [Verrucomicrobia bacterium]|nr:hypothetical protein [Verrucomicrobiota bacterium]
MRCKLNSGPASTAKSTRKAIFSKVASAQSIGALMDIGYNSPVCIEVKTPTFGKPLEGRKKPVGVSRNVLRPYFELRAPPDS